VKRALGSVIAAFALLACGSLLATPADETPDGGAGADATDGVRDDGSADGTMPSNDATAPPLPRQPAGCPLQKCLAPSGCVDDNCDKVPGDIPPFGNGITTNTSSALCTVTTSGAQGGKALAVPAAAPRSYVFLGFNAKNVQASDRAIASISIEGMPAAERFVVVARTGGFELCERNAAGERCTAPIQVTPPVLLLVYGIVTSENPPTAQFVLASETCSADHALVVSQPFPAGNIRGAVGCLEDGVSCVVQFSDIVFSVGAE